MTGEIGPHRLLRGSFYDVLMMILRLNYSLDLNSAIRSVWMVFSHSSIIMREPMARFVANYGKPKQLQNAEAAGHRQHFWWSYRGATLLTVVSPAQTTTHIPRQLPDYSKICAYAVLSTSFN